MAEAAGLVLAVIPLVISALEHYAERVDTITKWWSYSRELNGLVRILHAEYDRFRGTCEKLLHGLVSSAELNALIEHPGGPLWRNKVLEQKLKIRLQSSYSSYSRSIKDMVEAVKELETKLEIGPNGKNMELEPARKRRRRGGPLFKSTQEHARDLYSVISRGWTCDCAGPHQANLGLDDRLKDLEISHINESLGDGPGNFSVQFKVMFSVNTVSLSSETVSICDTFLQPETMEDQQYSAVQQPNNTRQNASTKSQDVPMLSTHSLYAANPQFPTTSTLRKVLSRKSGRYAGPSLYDDIISGRDPKNVEASGLSNFIKKGVEFVESPIPKTFELSKPISEAKNADLVKIEDLCLTIHHCMEDMKYDSRCLGYLAHESHYGLGVYLPPVSQVLHGKPNIRSLAHLLSSKQDGHNQLIPTTGNLSLCRGDRLNLALTIASSVLQLYKTPWLRDYWDKNDIIISGDHITNVREQVYVSVSFPAGTNEGSRLMNKFPGRNVTLFALSIVLIEICLGQSLESLRSPEDPLDSEGRADGLTNWSTAKRMENAVYREAGSRYGDTVRRCLYCEFDRRDTNLENDTFRQAVYDGVVTPLEDDVKEFFLLYQ
ncbi:hypothetical protein MMC32_001524 [Xylographa parallela]|nr:hypothetical protein [Xylographa parallela]